MDAAIKQLLWARVEAARATGTFGRGFRYDLEDYLGAVWPERTVAELIPLSVQAAKRTAGHRGSYQEHVKAGLVYEHMVPLKVISGLLLDCETPDDMVDTLHRYFQVAWVTKEEDTRMNQMGLRSKMPSDWDGTTYARYAVGGIKLEAN